MSEGQIRFHQLLELRILSVIKKKFVGEALTPDLLRQVRDEVLAVVKGVFDKSSLNLSEEAVSWVASQHFKRIKLNDEQMVNDLVIINEHKLSELPYGEIELLKNLFSPTALGPLLLDEYTRRSKA